MLTYKHLLVKKLDLFKTEKAILNRLQIQLIIFPILCILTLFGQICAAENINCNIIGHWPFNGNGTDITGNRLNANTTNCAYVTDKFGVTNSALMIDPSIPFTNHPSQHVYISLNNNARYTISNGVTICVWAKPLSGNISLLYQGGCNFS